MTNEALYRDHLKQLDGFLIDALERAAKGGCDLEGVLFHSGRPIYHHRDDHPMSFRATPHLQRYVPLNAPDQMVLARPGRRPVVIRVVPCDYWEEIAPPAESYWQNSVELHEVRSTGAAKELLGSVDRLAFIGGSVEAATELGIARERIEPEALLFPLDWHRATKTPHEVALLDAACARAAEGQRVARKAFEAGASEREIHFAYLAAIDQLEEEMPFRTIVSFNDKLGILHYLNKRGREAGRGFSFMLDAGATVDYYAADLTRTWSRADALPEYRALLVGIDRFQRELVAMVRPHSAYQEIHAGAHRMTAELLCQVGVLHCSPDEAYSTGLTRSFFPHGVGHHLGLQVHDVGGKQAAPAGGTVPPPDGHPYLRTTRPLAPGHVVTIEPGIYFIPMLLEPLRQGPLAAKVNWRLVDSLLPLGGMRIEDDVLCTAGEPRDLSRGYISGPSEN